jgi:hypothetical protein
MIHIIRNHIYETSENDGFIAPKNNNNNQLIFIQALKYLFNVVNNN